MAGRTTVGLDIGTSGVRAAELSVAKGTVTLERFGQVALPPGAVRDGEVCDPETVGATIRQLWRSAKFSSKKVVIGVANQKIVVRQMDVPWMPVSELRKSLAFQVKDFIPMPVETAILDFHPVEEVTGDGGARMLRILLVAAGKDSVTSALDAVGRAGLEATQVDLTAFAVLRSTVRPDASALADSSAEALVDVGSRITNIIVHQNGVPRFVRMLLMGGEHITEAVAERLGVPMDQAEAIKQHTPIPVNREIAAAGQPTDRVLELSSSQLIDEIRGSLDYYLAQPMAIPVNRLVLSGGGMRLGNFGQRLATATRLPVQPAGVFGRLRVGNTGLSAEQLQYVEPVAVVPVGLAMGVSA